MWKPTSCLVLSVVLLPGLAGADCDPPIDFANRATVIEGDFRSTLAVDRTTYAVGDSVRFFFSLKNIGPDSVTVECVETPFHNFLVMADTCRSPDQGECLTEALFSFPDFVIFFCQPPVLKPGDCLSWQNTWDGVPETGGDAPPGWYTVMAGTSPVMVGTPFLVPGEGVLLKIRLEDVTSLQETTWGLLKDRYE